MKGEGRLSSGSPGESACSSWPFKDGSSCLMCVIAIALRRVKPSALRVGLSRRAEGTLLGFQTEPQMCEQ